jgi:hypothetical protein
VLPAEHAALVRPDPIPSHANLTSARLVLQQQSTGPSKLTAHRITAPWAEASVTWSSFGNAFAPAPAATATVGSSSKVSLDIEALAQEWVDCVFEGRLLQNGHALGRSALPGAGLRGSLHRQRVLFWGVRRYRGLVPWGMAGGWNDLLQLVWRG